MICYDLKKKKSSDAVNAQLFIKEISRIHICVCLAAYLSDEIIK